MSTLNTANDQLCYYGTGFTVQARAYSYAGAPAYEVYVETPSKGFGPVAFYEATDDGLDIDYINVSLVDDAAAAAYQTVYGAPPVTGGDTYELYAIRGELYEAIEVNLLAECQMVTPAFEPFLNDTVSFENERWYVVAEPDGCVYLKHLVTSYDTSDAYRLIRNERGDVQIVQTARTWVNHDPLFGYRADTGVRVSAGDLANELDSVFATAIQGWKQKGVVR